MDTEWICHFAWHRRGNGLLTFQNAAAVGVDFELVQTVEGFLFLVVRANDSTLLGATDLGLLLELNGSAQLNGFDDFEHAIRANCGRRTSAVHVDINDDWATLRVNDAQTACNNSPPVVRYRFPVTNLDLEEPPVASWMLKGTRVSVEPVLGYDAVVSTLRSRDRMAVTATFTVENSDRLIALELASTVCELASFGCGCRVQWLRQEGLAEDGRIVWTEARNAITGPFVPMPMIEDGHFWDFIEKHGPAYFEFRNAYPLDSRRLLGMLLNATSEDDFLELRGAKLAIAVDALTKIAMSGEPSSWFSSPESRKEFLISIRDHIREIAAKFLPPDAADASGDFENRVGQLAERAAGLVRPTFRETILEVCNCLRVSVADDDIGIFVRARNSLVHQGRFVCQGESSPKTWPFASPSEEYFWMLRFVDRLVLRTLGYRGEFLDRSAANSKTVDAETKPD